VQSEVDLTDFLRAGGQIPIPLDQVVIELRRTSDSSVAFRDSRSIREISQAGGNLTMRVSFILDRSPEDFYLKVEAKGGGVLYYVAQAIVTMEAGKTITLPPLTPSYVGPGANADEVQLTLSQGRVAPGDSVLATAVALVNGTAILGAPIGILTSDSQQVLPRAEGIDQAYLVAAANATAGVTVTALLPNGVSTQTTLSVGTANPPFAANPNSPLTQNAIVNQLAGSPPSVVVLDANDAPVAGVSVTFAISGGGGALTGATQTTDANGIATVGGWRMGQTAGNNAVTASVTGLTPITFTAAAGPTTVASLAKISGDNQTANAGSALAAPLVIEVRDTFANVIPQATVTWTVTDGTITPGSGPSDAQGRAQAAWTLGVSQANPTATATVGSVQTGFAATAIAQTPTVQLGFAGVPGIGIGLTATVNVTLNQPATGTTAVALSSGNTGVFTIALPDTAYIPQGQTSGTKVLNGISAGTATLTGTAPGYNAGTLTVVVQNRNVSVPTTLNVPYGQTASLPIQLPAPAPAGGVTFAVSTTNGTLVGVLTPSVTIAAGGQTANATLSGVLPGTATVSVANAAFVTGSSSVTTAAALNLVQTSASLNASFGVKVDVDFTSNGQGIAAPSPGVPVTAEITDSGCLATATPVTIPTGLVSTQLTLTYGGSTNLPCTTKLKVTAPNIQPDSINVTVSPVPLITLSTPTVGSGLQINTNGSLGASNHGGVTVHLVSGSPNLLLAPDANTPGAGTLDVSVLPNQSSFSYVVQAVEGLTGTTGVTVQASAPGFANGSATTNLVQGAIDLTGVPANTTTLTPSTVLTVRAGIPNSQTAPTFLTQLQAVRAGAPAALTATVNSSTPAVADLVKSGPNAGGTQTVPIPILVSTSPSDTTTGGVRLRPLTTGSTVISASIPGFLAVTTALGSTVTVTQPTIAVSPAVVGSGLQVGASGTLGASNHGGVTVHLVSGDPNLLLAPNATTPGAASTDIAVPVNQVSFSYVVQALEGQIGTTAVTIQASAPGFSNGSGTISLVQGAIDLTGVPANTTTLTPSTVLTVRAGIPNSQTAPSFLTQLQAVRAGAPAALTATVNSQTPAVADLVKAGPNAGGSQTVQIPVLGTTSPNDTTTGGLRLRPLITGSSVISASIPGYLQVTNAISSTVSVTQPIITVSPVTVGSGLQVGASGSLGASNHGGVTVHLVSGSANLLLAPDANTLGSGTLDIAVPNNQTNFSYVVQALEGQTGTTPVTVQANASAFANGSGTITMVQGAVDLSGMPATTTTLTPTNNLVARVGLPNSQTAPGFLTQLQAVRAGAPSALTATFRSSTAAVGDLVKAGPVNGGTQTATIPIRGTSTPSDTTTGGVLFRPLLAGTTTVSVDVPGFLQVTNAVGSTVVISQPAIALNTQVVGRGLQIANSGSLGAANHGGVTVQLTSSNPALLLAPDAVTPGASTTSVFVANGQTGFSYYVQGLEDAQRFDTVTVAVTGVASGFTNGNGTVDVIPPSFDVSGLPASANAGGPDDPFTVRVGRANNNNPGSFMTQLQAVRAGAPGPVTVTVSAAPTTVGTLVKTAGPAGTYTVQIPIGATTTPSSVAANGIAFRPVASGMVTLTASIPGMSGIPVTAGTKDAIVTVQVN